MIYPAVACAGPAGCLGLFSVKLRIFANPFPPTAVFFAFIFHTPPDLYAPFPSRGRELFSGISLEINAILFRLQAPKKETKNIFRAPLTEGNQTLTQVKLIQQFKKCSNFIGGPVLSGYSLVLLWGKTQNRKVIKWPEYGAGGQAEAPQKAAIQVNLHNLNRLCGSQAAGWPARGKKKSQDRPCLGQS